jgi:hypothetical protein
MQTDRDARVRDVEKRPHESPTQVGTGERNQARDYQPNPLEYDHALGHRVRRITENFDSNGNR